MTALAASVVIASNPHDNDIAAVLAAYAQQAGAEGAFEVIVVDNGTRPDVAAACRAQGRGSPSLPLRCIPCARPGRAAANNVGVRAAGAPLIVFAADDFVPSRAFVRAHVDFHRHRLDGGVGVGPAFFTARCRDDPFRRWLEESGHLFGVPFRTASLHWPRDFFYVGNASLPRTLVDRVGGFDEAFEHDALDDLDFGLRLRAQGVRTHLVRKAVAWHDHPVTFEERRDAMRRAGASAAALERRRPGARPWAALVDPPVGGSGAVGPAIAGRSDPEHFRIAMDRAFASGYHGA